MVMLFTPNIAADTMWRAGHVAVPDELWHPDLVSRERPSGFRGWQAGRQDPHTWLRSSSRVCCSPRAACSPAGAVSSPRLFSLPL